MKTSTTARTVTAMFVGAGLLLVILSLGLNAMEPAVSEFLLAAGATIVLVGLIFILVQVMLAAGKVS